MSGLILLGMGLVLAIGSVLTAMRPESPADAFWS